MAFTGWDFSPGAGVVGSDFWSAMAGVAKLETSAAPVKVANRARPRPRLRALFMVLLDKGGQNIAPCVRSGRSGATGKLLLACGDDPEMIR
ncbi:hypothetical protein GCM10011512_16630 [Tersicoccus solisilvae]|uniref:Beta-ketoacyl synthase N-terminal domain-containing protein n=1 Tax=Tersicoccus solisilvae TaxID=1882339 RepID=A0ABQ1P3G0_9MICC|nr:hypothetical protein GCM10011512_16630 [Tersicoccus solisilvae]